ncbi:MAG: tetratricopeptide repeat protein [Bacteroidetes bacterium]|nr:tetratricopeptide repeat protein [Bacteroidota bacterium]MBU1717780.1 tetratricopeptide repeat protein [Bacteroidota bacterium]
MENIDRLLEKYLNLELEGQELSAFQQLMMSDSLIMKKVAFHNDIDQVLKSESIDSQALSLRSNLDLLHEEFYGRQTKHRRLVFTGLAAAASLAVLITISVLLFSGSYLSGRPDYYEPPVILRSGVAVSPDMQNAYELYEQEKYSEALSAFSSVLQKDTENQSAMFYMAVCNMETDNYISAEKTLALLSETKGSLYHEYALWYRAICLVELNRIGEARPLLNEISETNGVFSGKANDVLENLR